jgi:hypothetical protein
VAKGRERIEYPTSTTPGPGSIDGRRILLLSGPMDELLQNSEALAGTFTVYRELVGYYVVSNNAHAIEVRAHMRRHNHGAFLPSLYQDLSDICTHFMKNRDAESWDESAVSDLRSALSCISSLVYMSDVSGVRLCAPTNNMVRI